MVTEKKEKLSNHLIKEEWDGLEKDVIVNNFSSIKKQVQACIEAIPSIKLLIKFVAIMLGFHKSFFYLPTTLKN